jgi:hypothetical protein
VDYFKIVAGPNPGVDRADAEPQLRSALRKSGAGRIRSSSQPDKHYSFEMRAERVGDVFEAVTRVFRAVYGLQWWAEVIQLSDNPSVQDQARRARWN